MRPARITAALLTALCAVCTVIPASAAPTLRPPYVITSLAAGDGVVWAVLEPLSDLVPILVETSVTTG